ncbi:MAG: type I-MYXAN CRISPR-associated Cas8a1/Cmx1 [Syntrophobacteraceae bacterium]|jgi:CRISPR-associated protein Cas8a1/Csx13
MADDLTPTVEWKLSDEGMGILERAGLAGLYLSLTAADEWAHEGLSQAVEIKRIIEWKVDSVSVQLWWDQKDLFVLSKLLDWAWQSKDGIIFAPGIHRTRDSLEHPWMRLEAHSGMLQTFFQHNRVLPREAQSSEIIQLDENDTFSVSFKKIRKGFPQPKELAKIVRVGINCEKFIEMKSWIHPGAAKRFGQAGGEKDWAGLPRIAFILMFAPIACAYFKMPLSKVKSSYFQNWAFLVPEVNNLDEFARSFIPAQRASYNELLHIGVQSLGDACLRFACGYVGRQFAKRQKTHKLYITTMGQVGHYQGQSIRKDILDVIPSSDSIQRYVKVIKIMANMFVKRQLKQQDTQDTHEEDIHPTLYIRQPTARGRIADNLIKNLYWYNDLLIPPRWQLDELERQRQQYRKKYNEDISQERLWFSNLQRQWRELMDLIQEEVMWESPNEQAFVEVFHSTLRLLLSKEEDAITRGGSRNLHERWENRVEKIRRELIHAKTLALTRKLIVELLSEGGGNRELTKNKKSIWHLLNHPHDWKKAKDLSLLALVTFTDKRLARLDQTKKDIEENGNE